MDLKWSPQLPLIDLSPFLESLAHLGVSRGLHWLNGGHMTYSWWQERKFSYLHIYLYLSADNIEQHSEAIVRFLWTTDAKKEVITCCKITLPVCLAQRSAFSVLTWEKIARGVIVFLWNAKCMFFLPFRHQIWICQWNKVAWTSTNWKCRGRGLLFYPWDVFGYVLWMWSVQPMWSVTRIMSWLQ